MYRTSYNDHVSSLTYIEKRNLEDFLQMGGGYVSNFSNQTFQEFVFDAVGLDIYDNRIGGLASSKARRLRYFWKNQPDHIVGKLLKDAIDQQEGEPALKERCRKIAQRLMAAAPVPDAEVITVLSQRQEFEHVAKGVRDCIEKNEPEMGLDRLHTFVTKYVRTLCQNHGIVVDRDKPLHSIFGEYIKKLRNMNAMESKMTETILKSSISVFDTFNDVRNNKSLAHDNPVLNRNESMLILNHVTSTMRFLWALEQSIENSEPQVSSLDEESIPF